MATALKYPWDEPRPRSRIEEDRLHSLEGISKVVGETKPVFRRADVMELAAMDKSDWAWAITYNEFVPGFKPEGESYKLYSVKEVRALRMAMRLKKRGMKNHLVKAFVSQYLPQQPIQTTLPLDVAEDRAEVNHLRSAGRPQAV